MRVALDDEIGGLITCARRKCLRVNDAADEGVDAKDGVNEELVGDFEVCGTSMWMEEKNSLLPKDECESITCAMKKKPLVTFLQSNMMKAATEPQCQTIIMKCCT